MDQLTSGRSGLVWSLAALLSSAPSPVPPTVGESSQILVSFAAAQFPAPLTAPTGTYSTKYRRLAGPRSTLHASRETRRACASILSMLALCLYIPPRHEYLFPSFCRSRYMDSLCGYAVEVHMELNSPLQLLPTGAATGACAAPPVVAPGLPTRPKPLPALRNTPYASCTGTRHARTVPARLCTVLYSTSPLVPLLVLHCNAQYR